MLSTFEMNKDKFYNINESYKKQLLFLEEKYKYKNIKISFISNNNYAYFSIISGEVMTGVMPFNYVYEDKISSLSHIDYTSFMRIKKINNILRKTNV